MAGKNSIGVGSVCFEPPSTRADGAVVKGGRWRATHVDLGVAQSALLDRLAPYTVLSCRKACRQIFAEAVKIGPIATNPFDLVPAPRAVGVKEGRALSAADARKLVTAAAPIRLGVAVTLLFCQGWRVSAVLDLTWDDLDLEAGTAHIRRAATHSVASGVTIGPTKTSGAQGLHHLAPIAVEQLRAHRAQQAAERLAAGSAWPAHTYQGKPISPVFINTVGGLVNRQAITKVIQRTAQCAGLDPAGLATHAGRRTVITALYAEGGLDLTDVARHVGHSNQSTSSTRRARQACSHPATHASLCATHRTLGPPTLRRCAHRGQAMTDTTRPVTLARIH